ncbi:MAG: zinc ribbon domain-containing protein [Spirochaetes bacterium]|nr:zinc ribbon domain-containing protein [Spirochaetota bacterium]
MPIFEYACKECGNTFEQLVMSKNIHISCPRCDGGQIAKLFSTFAHRSSGKTESASGSGCSTCSTRNCASCG